MLTDEEPVQALPDAAFFRSTRRARIMKRLWNSPGSLLKTRRGPMLAMFLTY